MPKRIQRKRTKGWRAPEGAVYVGRGSKWGNPYLITKFRDGLGEPAARVLIPEDHTSSTFFGDSLLPDKPSGPTQAAHYAVALYARRWAPLHTEVIRSELRGKTLMCWCAEDAPCHADVLLELANQEE